MEGPRTIGFWGRSGATKSTQLLFLAERAFKKTGKHTRVIIYRDDNAKKLIEGSGLEEMGAIDVYDASEDYKTAFSVQAWLAEGYWYRKGHDGRKYLNKQPAYMTTKEEWARIWGYGVEGGTGMSEWLAASIGQSKEKKAWNKPWAYEEGDYVFGGIAEQHIGLIQQTVLENIAKMKQNLPISTLIWTFHDGHGEAGKKGSGETILGPKIMGQAITSSVPKYFMDFIHLCREDTEVISNNELGQQTVTKQKRVWAYWQEHEDKVSGLPCLAMIRVPAKYLKHLFGPWVKGGVGHENGGMMLEYETGVVPLYEVIEKIEEHAKAEARRVVEEIRMRQQGQQQG